MRALKPFIVAILILATAVSAALAFESVYRISIRPRQPAARVSLTPASAGAPPAAAPVRTTAQPVLGLRLVDIGGVGIPLSGWGKDYSHDRRIFREAILEPAPYIDAAAFQRIESDWHAYVERMVEYGNNAIAVPMLLELIDFDRLPRQRVRPDAGPIYAPDSPFRARHAAVRRHFGPLLERTGRQGLDVFLDTDMLTLTPPLADHLRALAPHKGAVGIDPADPAVWEVYRAGLEELFDAFPSIKGVVIRFGEGGSLYNTDGWPYRSEMAIRNADGLRAMLRGLLPVFEARAKTLVLRSWTVGVGQLGRLHIDPKVYEKVLGDIDSPALVVSTKFTAGDFFSYLPLNPTLTSGRHRRIVELQAKPEFEGFSAFPNFLGEEHARALRTLCAANPRIAGTYVLTQAGGPLRAGPRTLYPVHGFWLWTDANVFVASHLAIDPDADVGQLARRWAEARFGSDPRIVDAIAGVLTETRDAVLRGFYIRPFAEREVRVPGLELPPLMWIFEWDMVGGWHSLLSLVYRATRDDIDLAIDEGHAAAAAVRRARQQLQAAFASNAPRACGAACDQALRSLEYQETLFDALAAWRQTFLSYYRWLDTGERDAWTKWRDGREQFQAAAARHVSQFGTDLDFPAFNLTSATQAVTAAERGRWARRIAIVLLIAIGAILALGSPLGQRWNAPAVNVASGSGRASSAKVDTPSGRVRAEGLGEHGPGTSALARFARLTWTAVATPWRLGREPVDVASSVAVTTLALSLVGFVVAALTSFTTAWMGAGSPLLLAIVALAFESTAFGAARRQGRGRLLVASVGPLIPGLMALFVLIAYVGPLGFWYRFWISPTFRVLFLTIVLAMPLWTVYVMLAAHTLDGWRGRVGGSLAATGAGFVALTALLPDWVHVLRFLDRPLNFAPATDTMLFALRTYAGVRLDIGGVSWLLGALLLAGGYALLSFVAMSSNRRRAGSA